MVGLILALQLMHGACLNCFDSSGNPTTYTVTASTKYPLGVFGSSDDMTY